MASSDDFIDEVQKKRLIYGYFLPNELKQEHVPLLQNSFLEVCKWQKWVEKLESVNEFTPVTRTMLEAIYTEIKNDHGLQICCFEASPFCVFSLYDGAMDYCDVPDMNSDIEDDEDEDATWDSTTALVKVSNFLDLLYLLLQTFVSVFPLSMTSLDNRFPCSQPHILSIGTFNCDGIGSTSKLDQVAQLFHSHSALLVQEYRVKAPYLSFSEELHRNTVLQKVIHASVPTAPPTGGESPTLFYDPKLWTVSRHGYVHNDLYWRIPYCFELRSNVADFRVILITCHLKPGKSEYACREHDLKLLNEWIQSQIDEG